MDTSEKLFEQAQKVMPGGVNSPVRAYRAVGMTPRFIQSAKGAYITDVDGVRYIDYVGSWGPMILGHANPQVLRAVEQTMKNGLSFGAPTERETDLANLVVSMVPNIEMVRMVNSGTEAVMSAVRVARGATGKDKIIKFEGCYHGHSDAMLVKAGSGALTGGRPDSAGVPAAVAGDTLTATYNDLDSVERLLQANKGQVAAVIVEPVAANMGVVPPAQGFLEGLRALCDEYHALLIFDEVITGFRLARGGAQEYFGVKADLDALADALPETIDAMFLCHGIALKADASNALEVQKVNFLSHKYLLEKTLPKIAENGSVNIIASTGGFGWQDAFADCAAVVNAPSYEAALDWYAAHPDVIQNGYVFSKQCLCDSHTLPLSAGETFQLFLLFVLQTDHMQKTV